MVLGAKTWVVTLDETRRSAEAANSGSSSLQAAAVSVVRQRLVTQSTVSKVRPVPGLVVEMRSAVGIAPVVYE